DALLYDWDYLPAERRQAVLAELLDRPLPCPVAVHGYNLDDDLGETLSQKGVTVSRYLEPELFVQLRSAADAVVPDAAGTGSFVQSVVDGTLSTALTPLLGRILLILLVVELLYTVQVSFREHVLAPEPFLLIGIISVIRRVLLVTAEFGELKETPEDVFRHFI